MITQYNHHYPCMNNALRLLPVLFFVVFTLLYSCKKESNPHAQHPVQDSVVTPLPYPVDSLVGVYYVTGYYKEWGMDTLYPPHAFNTYDTVGLANLVSHSSWSTPSLPYVANASDSALRYTFYDYGNLGYDSLVFPKSYNGTFYLHTYRQYSPGGGTDTYEQGVKVH